MLLEIQFYFTMKIVIRNSMKSKIEFNLNYEYTRVYRSSYDVFVKSSEIVHRIHQISNAQFPDVLGGVHDKRSCSNDSHFFSLLLDRKDGVIAVRWLMSSPQITKNGNIHN